MHQTEGTGHRVDDENRATVSHVNAEANLALIRDQTVTSIETLVLRCLLIDHTNARPVNLLGGNEGRAIESMFPPDFAMDAVQPRQRFHLVVRHLEARSTQGEAVDNARLRAQGREMFRRNRTLVHLPELVRVVRVV